MNRRRIIRRGGTYGPPLPEGPEDDGAERGIAAFVGCASLIRQYEFAQNVWVNDPRFHELGNERDPIIGAHDGSYDMTIPRRPIKKKITGLPAFTTVTGGAYFFLPETSRSPLPGEWGAVTMQFTEAAAGRREYLGRGVRRLEHAVGGLGLTVPQVLAPLKNVRLVVLSLLANFVLAPLTAIGLARVLGLDEPLAVGLLLCGVAAGAPFLIKLAELGKGDMPFAVGIMVVLMVITVGYMPIVLPLLVEGVSVDPGNIARSLIVLMLLPLAAGLARSGMAPADCRASQSGRCASVEHQHDLRRDADDAGTFQEHAERPGYTSPSWRLSSSRSSASGSGWCSAVPAPARGRCSPSARPSAIRRRHWSSQARTSPMRKWSS